jgi:hypothetical protein
LQRSILTKLELRQPFEKSGFPTGQKRRFLIFATEPSQIPSRPISQAFVKDELTRALAWLARFAAMRPHLTGLG